ncbi:MAG: cytochrome c-type biogenesis protein [Acidimicrobiales bacterium]|jgi:cytochrome c-type biogenesis protein
MLDLNFAFAVSAFVAGLLMFLAPCTLPLVPAYLAFISGVKEKDAKRSKEARKKIRKNAIAFTLGFSAVFILFGILAGFFGSFVGQYRIVLSQVGGVFIIMFGLMMLDIIHIAPLMREHKFTLPKFVTPGESSSAFLIGGIFALGWTPCVGPVLASVLLIATTKATVLSGAFLLALFSAGLAVPFIATAVVYARAGNLIEKYSKVSRLVSIVGGLLLIGIGFLLLFNNFGLTVLYGYQFLEFIGIGSLLNYY